MITSRKCVTRWMFVSLSSLILILLLAACGGGGSASATPTPVPPTSAPTATATPAQSTQMQTYTGTGFTISYPADWKVQTEQTAIVFSDAQQMNTLTIAVAPNPGGVASASTVLAASLTTAEQAAKATNVQPVSGLPATSTVGGEAWVQSGVTGTVTDSGVAVSIELVGLAVNHPANSPSTKTFEIYYGGPALTFQQESAAVFQPMLQSFKF